MTIDILLKIAAAATIAAIATATVTVVAKETGIPKKYADEIKNAL